ncbi:hypothetical protein [Tepidanaerobacter syntrophicus]|uniref:Uncharacterized protein n=1 Tax=Tepidanaerobacter syntrophicus TaxID=224999 RepID=A0A0U9I2R5_9FIRM|nr:hypothetical protein [Tepidanaerobacter syntrophicus]GAQ24136.1 hypothetical protein TSYNT_1121 [Tepidanaerobacter syntrophicus]
MPRKKAGEAVFIEIGKPRELTDEERDKAYIEELKRSDDLEANIELILRHLGLFTGLVARRALRERWPISRITKFYNVTEEEVQDMIDAMAYESYRKYNLQKELGLINADEDVYERMADEIDFLRISKKELRQRVERYLKKHSEEER